MVKIIGYNFDEFYDDLYQPDAHTFNGVQFTNMCRDLLFSPHNTFLPLKAEYKIWPQSNGIADGGVDIIAVNQTDRSEVFFQCKYKIDGNGAEAVLNKICRTLKKELNEHPSQRYEPWITHPINAYVVCLSCGMNQGAIDRCRKDLKDMFAEAALNSGMAHLAELEVYIFCEAVFRAVMEADFSLSLRWLRASNFVEALDRGGNKRVEQFRDFLDSGHLTYFSREVFKAGLPADQAAFFEDEGDLLRFLSAEGNHAVVVYGQGGIGKTRLTLEVGRIAPESYTVLKVKNTLTMIEDLIMVTRRPGRYLLLFDYIEEHPLFLKIFPWLDKERIGRIKIIANCRTSFMQTVKEVAREDRVKFLDMSVQNTAEQRYKTEVVKRIIGTITDKKFTVKLEFNRILHSFCQERPAFAVFIKYQNFKNPGKEHLIHQESSFQHWVLTRLKLSLGDPGGSLIKKHKTVFMIMSCLPAADTVRQQLRRDFYELTSLLTKDGWIDDDGQTMSVVHDTINDILLGNFLKAEQFDDVIVDQLLHFALEHKSIPSLLRAIDRVWGDAVFDIPPVKRQAIQHQIGAFIKSVIDQDTANRHWFKDQLPFTKLISEADRIDILFNFRHLFGEVFSHIEYGYSLSYSMNWLIRNCYGEGLEIYAGQLADLLFNYWDVNGRFSDYAQHPVIGAHLISAYINLFGIDPYILAKFEVYLAKIPVQPKNLRFISYVLVAWLEKTKETTPTITELMRKWVNMFLEDRHDYFISGFLIEAWTKYGEDLDTIKPLLSSCLSDERIHDQARADIIGHWLERGAEPLLIKSFIETSLAAPIHPKSACYIIGFWLKSGNEPLLIKSYLAYWLERTMEPQIFAFIFQLWLEHGDEPELIVAALKRWYHEDVNEWSVGSILQNFLDCGGRWETISDELISWLRKNPEGEASPYLLGYWLKQVADKADFDLISPLIPGVLDQHLKATRDTGHILGNWIRLSGRPAEIQSYLVTWLEQYNNGMQAAILMRLWLESGYDPQIVKPFIAPFLYQFAHEKDSTTLVFNWMMHGDDPLLVRDFIKPLTERFSAEFATKYLLTNWLESGDDPGLVEKGIGVWLEQHYKKSESVYLVSLWTKHGNDPGLVSNYIENHFDQHLSAKGSNNVIEAWLKKGYDADFICTYVVRYLEIMPPERNCIGVANWWLKSGGALVVINRFIFHRFAEYGIYPESAILLQRCLNLKCKYELMLPLVLDYLAWHIEQHRAASLINTWLSRGFSWKPLQQYIRQICQMNEGNLFADYIDVRKDQIIPIETFISDHARQVNLSKMIFFHIKNGRDPEMVRDDVENYLHDFGQLLDASRVLSSWIEYGGDVELIRLALVQWLEMHALTENSSSFLIGVVLENSKIFPLGEGCAIEWLDKFGEDFDAKYVLSSWLKNPALDPGLIDARVSYWMDRHFKDGDGKKPMHWRDKLILDRYRDNNLRKPLHSCPKIPSAMQWFEPYDM